MRLARFCRDERGAMAILFAVAFALSSLVAALAVDAGSLYHQRRGIQNAVDLAALSAAASPNQAAAIALASLADAQLIDGADDTGLSVTIGRYDADPALPAAQRFTPQGTPTNAVRVAFEQPGTLHFARGWAPSPTIGASALATVTPEIAFSVGSRLASLEGGIANTVLNNLLGANIKLTALDYNGLANAEVDIFAYLDALALDLNVTAGTYDDLLQLSADHSALTRALARSLTGADRAVAQRIANALGQNGLVPLGKLFQLGGLGDFAIGTGAGDGLLTTISALDLLAASVGLANGSHHVELDFDVRLAGLAGLEGEVAIGEPPQGGGWFAVGPMGTVVRTAQVRVRLLATALGKGLLDDVAIRLPIYLELAHAEAVAGAATCPSPANPKGTATILTRPGALRAIVGEVNRAELPQFGKQPRVDIARILTVKAPILGLTLLQVLASALVEVAQTQPIPVKFSGSDIVNGVTHTAKVSTIASSLTGSLLDNLRLQVPILGLGLNLNSLTALLSAILKPLTPTLDLTLDRLLEALGLGIGEADIRVYGVRCSQPVLVG